MSTANLTQSNSPSFSEVIQTRRAIRHYDPSVHISHDEIKQLLEEANLAPSSTNLQPWRFFIIDTEELRTKLLPVTFHQKQVMEASAVIVVLGDTEGYKRAGEIYGEATKQGLMPEEVSKAFIEKTLNRYNALTKEDISRIILVDGGLVSQQFMLAARAHNYDTGPLGYDPVGLIQAFDISDRYIPIMVITLGKAEQPGHPSIRLPIDDITFFNTKPE
ncbi:nitroreductase family protein [Paenibacillus sp. ACRSA]|uniref:nitroreductase family protein n=1 Tax=Paenibacillus sp. ACRSA TaxID=2918211 RepID=UPI001EF42261|nr:nitroreductase family protein [Paenibacillus sp. ACRSA]MCG7378710.1 nitroreductase family protein [Paenibacillus sp. ACRSA]